MMHGYERHHVDGDRVYRFVRIERLAHWVNVVGFFALAGSGVVLLLRHRFGLGEGDVAWLHDAHFYVGAAYFFGPALIFLIGDWRAGLRWCLESLRWTMSEMLWLLGPARKILLPGSREPLVGRFNAGQRMNLLGQILGKWALAVSGYRMHVHEGQLLMYDFHLIVFVLLSGLVAGHIYMGLVNPTTRVARFAMLSGFVDRAWLEHHHPEWVKSLPHAARGADAAVDSDRGASR